MEFELYTFSEALEKLKKKEISMLIRAKHMKADFLNKWILLYKTEKYIKISSNPDILWQTVLNKSGNRISSYAEIESDDILADDYIDTSQWILFENEEDYDNAKMNK